MIEEGRSRDDSLEFLNEGANEIQKGNLSNGVIFLKKLIKNVNEEKYPYFFIEKAVDIFTNLDKENRLETRNAYLFTELLNHLRKAKKIVYLKKKEMKKKKTQELKNYLQTLIDLDQDSDSNFKSEQKSLLITSIDTNKMLDLNGNYDIPEYYCCKITFVSIFFP